MGVTTTVASSGRPVPSSEWRARPTTADSHPSPPPHCRCTPRCPATTPPRQRSCGRPRPLMHGGWAATPLQTVPIAAPAIQARPFRLQDPLRLLSGRPNSCSTATGPISPLHAALSTARAALVKRPPSTRAPREALRRRSSPGLTAPPLSDCSVSDAWEPRRRKKIQRASLCACRDKISGESREPAFERSGPDRQFLVSE